MFEASTMTTAKNVAYRLAETASRIWLMKSEPRECSIDDTMNAPDQSVSWFGIRNYQARNFIRDEMSVGDAVLFYHSSCPQPGIVGLAVIDSTAYPDELQFDPQSEYYDPKSTPENPRWLTINVKGLKKIPLISLADLRNEPALSGLRILQKGNRLSITPVTKDDFLFIADRFL